MIAETEESKKKKGWDLIKGRIRVLQIRRLVVNLKDPVR